MRSDKFTRLFWASPLIGLVCNFTISAIIVISDPIIYTYSEPAQYTSLGLFLYFLLMSFIIIFTYLYLFAIRRLSKFYWPFTISSLILITIGSIYIYNDIFERGTDFPAKILSTLKYLLWVSLYCIPVYWAAHLYRGRNKKKGEETIMLNHHL